MKLIKLNTDHYVVVDDSEIKEGDWYLTFQNNEVIGEPRKCEDSSYSFIHCKKITHSTTSANLDVYGQTPVGLSLSEVKELLGEEDVEKKVEEVFPIISGSHPNINWDRANLQEGFVTGYNQAIEDNKDKKYTEEDLRKMFEMGIGLSSFSDTDENKFRYALEHIKPKTEWEVEFIDGKLTLKQ